MKLKEANIISFLFIFELGQLQQLFMNRIVILSRP